MLQISSNITISIRQIVEKEESSFNFLHLLPEDEQQIKSIKLQNVRLQKWACRAALAKLLNTNKVEITYSKTGQPLLKNHHISFSHTKNSVAVALASIPVGIDIEEITPRISRLYPSFMSKQEIQSCDTHNLKDLYYFWCAKEAMYKWFAHKNLNFIEDLQVNKEENKGIVCKKHILQLTPIWTDKELVMVCS